MKKQIIAGILVFFFVFQVLAGGNYKNFKVSVYSRAYETVKMGDEKWLEPILGRNQQTSSC